MIKVSSKRGKKEITQIGCHNLTALAVGEEMTILPVFLVIYG